MPNDERPLKLLSSLTEKELQALNEKHVPATAHFADAVTGRGLCGGEGSVTRDFWDVRCPECQEEYRRLIGLL